VGVVWFPETRGWGKADVCSSIALDPRGGIFYMPCLEEPKLVAEVRFVEWTRDRHVRLPSFLALREDKKAREVVLDHRAGTALAR
jgi:ATP-dependent DNA ligase